MSDASNAPFFAVYNALAPGLGRGGEQTPPGCIRIRLDLVNGVPQKVDLSLLAAQEKLDTLQTIFIDNQANSFSTFVTVDTTRHRVGAGPGGFLCAPILLGQAGSIEVVATGMDQSVTIFLINVPLPAVHWQC